MKLLLVFTLSFLLIFPACKKSDINQSPSTIKGRVMLIDNSNHVVSNISGVKIYIESSGPQILLSVNNKGEFDFPAFNNNEQLVLVFSKEGYGTIRRTYLESSLDSELSEAVMLFPKSEVVINSFSGVLEGESIKLSFNVSAPAGNPNNGLTIMVPKNMAEISYDNFPATENIYYTNIPVVNGDNNHTFCLKCSKDCGYVQSGDKIYIKAYGDIHTPFGYAYVDEVTKKLVFPSINKTGSPTISFIVP